MKRKFFLCIIIAFFILMLCFPKFVFQGASEGLLLWFQTVLPTLLPFIIICNLLIHTGAFTYIARTCGPLIGRIFHVSPNGSFAVLTGFLCGYPMGAKVTSDLLRSEQISLSEGKYLLSFCNNTSPMFIMSYVLWQNLHREDLILPSLIILFATPALLSIPFRFHYLHADSKRHKSISQPEVPKKSDFQILDFCIMNGFETITKVGGYIILFSILLTLLKQLPSSMPLWNHILLPSLEITNGIPLLCSTMPNFSMQYVLVLALTSFGGVCSVAQTKSMLSGTGLSIFPYIIEKLITALATSFLAYLYLQL